MLNSATIIEGNPKPEFLSDEARIKVVCPNENQGIEVFGECMQVVLSCLDTQGQLTLHQVDTPSNGGPPLHVHTEEDKIFIVQSGIYEFHIGSQCIEAKPGTVVFCPRRVPHTFCNIGEDTGRVLILSLPGGCEEFFQRCAQEFATGAPRASAITQIGQDYGILFPKSGD